MHFRLLWRHLLEGLDLLKQDRQSPGKSHDERTGRRRGMIDPMAMKGRRQRRGPTQLIALTLISALVYWTGYAR